MPEYYIGLMSGTSMDGIDAALVSFSEAGLELHATHVTPYPQSLRDALLTAIQEPLEVELDQSGELHRRVGECFRDAALALIERGGVDPADVQAIGSHGQTIRHQPDADPPFSLQIGDPKVISAGTTITTIANFRQADIRAGGQGAPLVPPFHEWLFRSATINRVVVNIGGIANITALPAGEDDVRGFDTGPGNGLMDTWIQQHREQPFDRGGRWAASGKVVESLLAEFLADPYFALPPPKSTGFEYFNRNWLQQFDTEQQESVDVQATLCELTAQTISNAITAYTQGAAELFVCGGGVHNTDLMDRLQRYNPNTIVSSTSNAGLDPDWVEAVAFAWLAMRTLHGQTGNLPSVTGASHKVVLGELHCP